MHSETFRVRPVPPFRLDLTVWVLKRRPEYVIDRWDGKTYRRTLTIADQSVALAISQVGDPDSPELEITANGDSREPLDGQLVTQEVEQLLGTRVDLTDFYGLAESDERLSPLVTQFMGFKPTRYPTLFECLTNAITCQLVSLNVGLRVVSRLVQRYGTPGNGHPEQPPAFPSTAHVADADPDDLRAMGYSRQKARALIELAQGLETGDIDLEPLAGLDDATAIKRLTALRGVGRWTAEYALLRGLGRLHVFPGDDVGARNTLQQWSEVGEALNYDGVRQLLSDWQPYAGLIYFQMLLLGLEAHGRIGVPPPSR